MNLQWAAVWGCSPSISRIAPARYAKDITLRCAVRTLLDGSRIRLRLNNYGASEEAVITRVTVAPCDEKGVWTTDTALTLTFGGQERCVMPAGGSALSDPVDMILSRGADVAVSLYLGEIAPLATGTEISGPLTRQWFCEGDGSLMAEMPLAHTMHTETCFFLNTVEVLTDAAARAIVCFGDSITAQSWPDQLALRLAEENRTGLSVVRRGIGGSRVFHAYPNVQHRCYGPDGFERFAREVAVAGADRVVVLHGINDLMHPNGTAFRPWSDLPTAEEMIEGLRFYIRTAHELGLKICLGTIVTFKGWHTWNEDREARRQAVNDWIRTQREADAFVDFDAAIRDANDPQMRDPACDCGDHVHPSLEGARRMARCVPASFLL